MTQITKFVTLNDGVVMPRLAFGTGATAHYLKPCTPALVDALKAGVRHIDTAESYGNIECVGEAIREWGGDRKDVFVTTKWGLEDGISHPRLSLIGQLKLMKLDYVDLYLIHEPAWVKGMTQIEAWREMEALQAEGLCRSIGLSQYQAKDLKDLEHGWNITPSVNQVEYHPYLAHHHIYRDLAQASKEHNITIYGFTTLAPLWQSLDGPLDPVIKTIAVKRGLSDTLVLLLWAAQTIEGAIATTTKSPERLKEYLRLFEIDTLSHEEVEAITSAGEGRYYRKYSEGQNE